MLRVGKDRQKQKPMKENQRQTALDRVKAKKNIENNNLYDAWHEWTNDAWSNALRTIQFYFIKQQLTWT